MKLILFDVDGTLIDSQHIIVAAQRRAFAAVGLAPPSRERSLSIVGLSLTEAFTELVGPDGPIESLANAYKAAFADLRSDPAHQDMVFPGIADCLAGLASRQDVHLGIATGKSRRGLNNLFDNQGWHALFATTQTADDAPSKPHPAMIFQAMKELNVPADQVAIVGDSSFDMMMARAAGAVPIGVSWGFQPVSALRQAGAEIIVDTCQELVGVLGEFLDPGREMSNLSA